MGSFPSVTITQLLPDWANEVAKIEGTSFVKMKGDLWRRPRCQTMRRLRAGLRR